MVYRRPKPLVVGHSGIELTRPAQPQTGLPIRLHWASNVRDRCADPARPVGRLDLDSTAVVGYSVVTGCRGGAECQSEHRLGGGLADGAHETGVEWKAATRVHPLELGHDAVQLIDECGCQRRPRAHISVTGTACLRRVHAGHDSDDRRATAARRSRCHREPRKDPPAAAPRQRSAESRHPHGRRHPDPAPSQERPAVAEGHAANEVIGAVKPRISDALDETERSRTPAKRRPWRPAA